MTSMPAPSLFRPAVVRTFANLGCGPRGGARPRPLFSGWRELRVDADAAVEPDIVADLVDLSAIPTGSVQGVWCSHCLEHLYRHQLAGALAEISRILSSDGFACIMVPDLQAIAAYIAADRMLEPIYASPAGPISPHDVLFGFGDAIARGEELMAHRCGFTPSSLAQAIGEAGFGQYVVLKRPNYELTVVAHKAGWGSDEERDLLIGRLGL